MPVIPTLVVRGLDELMIGLEAMPAIEAAENERAMQQATLLVEAEIKDLTPRKTGRLFSGWSGHVAGTGFESVGIVDNNVSYGPFVEEDVRPHDIVANGNALMIPMTGAGFGGGKLSGGARAGQQVAFFKRVRHPGSRGKHMARQGLENATPGILQLFQMAMQRVLSMGK
jgi:hypothetical protein